MRDETQTVKMREETNSYCNVCGNGGAEKIETQLVEFFGVKSGSMVCDGCREDYEDDRRAQTEEDILFEM